MTKERNTPFADTSVAVVEAREPAAAESGLELSVVIPCLNEADTLAVCVRKAFDTMREHEIAGEVVVADNGSTDGSQEIAADLGARVVNVERKGYGSALMGGIAAARGRYVIMGDADDSYDFREIPRFVARLRDGYDLVQGCRLPSGGGTVMPGAMPPLHRWWGNPMFSRMARSWFHAPIHDVYCGLRGFTREMYARLDQRCTGMEFATEMIIKASLFGERIAEVPITLHPDGRKAHAPHLRTFRDGWRTLRFFMYYCPGRVFGLPGAALAAGGAAAGLLGVRSGNPASMVAASVLVITGAMALWLGALARRFAVAEGMLPPPPASHADATDRGLAIGALVSVAGLLLFGLAARAGANAVSGRLPLLIAGGTVAVLGLQSMTCSLFGGLLALRRR